MRSPLEHIDSSYLSSRPLTRRSLLAGAAGLAGTAALGPGRVIALGTSRAAPDEGVPRRVATKRPASSHLAWVWQFRHDGEEPAIRAQLAAHGLGIALKTHDSTNWMSRFDPTPSAVSGPKRVEELARFFEDGGVPFYTWNVVHGVDPVREATMAAETIDAGARGVFVDLEPFSGFWRGTPREAEIYGQALRLLQPNAWIATTVDARPWELPRIPMAEFAEFSDAVSPQVYWRSFTNGAHIRKYTEAGEDPGEEGVTPRFAVASAIRNLDPFGLPIHPIGDGTVGDAGEWSDFIEEAHTGNVDAFSVWRYGVMQPPIFELLRATPIRTALPVGGSASTYTVQPGDTLGSIAARWGTSVATLANFNGITNPNLLRVGQVLQNPSGAPAPVATPKPAAAGPAPVKPVAADASSGDVYVVEPGDSLWALARRWGTTVEEIAALNGIADPTLVGIGDKLRIP